MLRTGMALALLGAASIASGCGGSAGSSSNGGHSIPMQVLRSGPGVAANVQVLINGHTYVFRVDTGASRTAIDAGVAQTLRLPGRGREVFARALGCKVASRPVSVSDWSVGGVRLPPLVIAAQHRLLERRSRGTAVVGLLGSDVLRRFGGVTLDLVSQRLILGSPPPTNGRSLRMTVHTGRGGATFETVPVSVRGNSGAWALDTGAAISLVSPHTVAEGGLKPVGIPGIVHGATGCSVLTSPTAVRDWTAGGIALPPTLALSSRSSLVSEFAHQRISGVLGLDLLSRFGQVSFQFLSGRLVLGGTTSR